MINPFIKLTGFRDKQEIFISADKILIYNKHFHENYTEVEIDRLTIDVSETPEEIAVMIQKYYDEQMRLAFIRAALNGMCSDSDEFQSWDSVSKSAIHTANMVMENLKND